MLRLILVFIILAWGFAAAAVSRFAALLLYLWFAMFRPDGWIWWYDLSSLRLSFIIGLTLVIPSLLSGIFPNVSHLLSIGMIGFFITTLFGQFSALRPDVGWEWIDYLGRLIVVCLLTIRLTNTPRRWAMVLAVVAVSFGFHSAKAGLASIMSGGAQFYDGLSGAFMDNNGYALGAVMVIPLLIATAQNVPLLTGFDRHFFAIWLRRGLIIAALLSAYTVVSLFSRGGFIGLVAMTSIFLLLQRKRHSVALVVLGYVLLPFVPLPSGYAERIETINNYEEIQDKSALSRKHFWHVATEMAYAHPFFGVGLRNYEFTYDDFDFLNGIYGKGRSVHSSHFQVLAETGFIGSAFYVFLFTYGLTLCFRVRARSRRSELTPELQKFFYSASNAIIASMFGFLAGGSFIALALNDITWLTFALIASLDIISRNLCQPSTRVVPAIAVKAYDLVPST